jgi:hypothetical protein
MYCIDKRQKSFLPINAPAWGDLPGSWEEPLLRRTTMKPMYKVSVVLWLVATAALAVWVLAFSPFAQTTDPLVTAITSSVR